MNVSVESELQNVELNRCLSSSQYGIKDVRYLHVEYHSKLKRQSASQKRLSGCIFGNTY